MTGDAVPTGAPSIDDIGEDVDAGILPGTLRQVIIDIGSNNSLSTSVR